MKDIQICPVGEVRHENNKMYIQIYSQYAKALTGLNEYKHVMVVWWFDKCDNDKERNILEMVKPYKVGPEKMGMFALRQPQRPNPVAVSVAEILTIDYNSSIVEVRNCPKITFNITCLFLR
ncbi:MAG: TrmO family methyltransferase [Lachnospiraceae bacterium]